MDVTEIQARLAGVNADNRQGCVSGPLESGDSKEDVTHSTANSSVPSKLLKFLKAPKKYVYEMSLIDVLIREQSAEQHRAWYETTFCEPISTFNDDKRVKILLDVLNSDVRRRRLQFIAWCLSELHNLDNTGILQSSEEVMRNNTQEIDHLERRIEELLQKLQELDPKLAPKAKKLFGSQP